MKELDYNIIDDDLPPPPPSAAQKKEGEEKDEEEEVVEIATPSVSNMLIFVRDEKMQGSKIRKRMPPGLMNRR